MAYDLAQLTNALRSAGPAQADLEGFTADMKRADALQDTPEAALRPDMGLYSLLSEVGNSMKRSRGAKQAAALAPQMADARARVNEGEVAKVLHNATRQADQTTYDRSRNAAGDLINAQTREEDLVWREGALNRAKQQAQDAHDITAGSTTGAGKTYANPDGSGIVTAFMTKRGPVDSQRQPLDLTGKLPYTAPKTAAKGAGGGLTMGQTQTGLDKLEKKLKPVEAIQAAVTALDDQLRKYTKGGEKEGADIAGVGTLEGNIGEGFWGGVGDVVRYSLDAMSGNTDASTTASALVGVIAPIIRNQAGLAQTLSETNKVIRAYGLQNVTDEKVLLQRYPEIKRALEDDLDRIQRTTMPEVMQRYTDSAQGVNAFTNRPEYLDFSAHGVEPPPELNAELQAKQARIAELRRKAAGGQ